MTVPDDDDINDEEDNNNILDLRMHP